MDKAPGTFELLGKDGNARAGLLHTAHGVIETPIFMPVGTVGSVKALAPDDLEAIGAQIILATPILSICARAKSGWHGAAACTN